MGSVRSKLFVDVDLPELEGQVNAFLATLAPNNVLEVALSSVAMSSTTMKHCIMVVYLEV